MFLIIVFDPIEQLFPIITFFSIMVLWPIKQFFPIFTLEPIRTFFPNFTLFLNLVFDISLTELSKSSLTEWGYKISVTLAVLIRTFSTIIFLHLSGKLSWKFFEVIQAAAFVLDACGLYLFEWRKVISLEVAEFKSAISNIFISLLSSFFLIFKTF